jgi:hypothetical protein
MEETMLILSKGIKWLVVMSAGSYLASTATTTHAPHSAVQEPIALEVSHEVTPFPALGINEIMQMLAH